MVKQRPGSRKGLTKLDPSTRKAHRRKARSRVVVPNKHLRESWDKALTPSQNLSAAGLQSTVNSLQKGKRKQKEVVVVPVNKEVLKMMEDDAARGERVNRVVRPGERIALEAMVRKHGDDYAAMAKDIKMNYLQWTPQQLRRKIKRMQEILGGEE